MNDGWREALNECVKNGYDYRIKRGSYKGQIRRQLENLTLIIERPWTKPFNFYMPGAATIPPPTDHRRVNRYFEEYIITDTKCEGEDYTYGQYIAPNISKVIQILNEAEGQTNQATINIGRPEDIDLDDPPCLRVVDFKVVNNSLNLSVYFRSWDLFAGLPENLGGLQLLKEFVLMHLDFPVVDGKLQAFSTGAHVYEQYFPIVNTLNIHQIAIKEDV